MILFGRVKLLCRLQKGLYLSTVLSQHLGKNPRCGLFLTFIVIENGGSVLTSFVRKVPARPEHAQILPDKTLIRDFIRVEDHPDRFGMPCSTGTDQLVSGLRYVPSGIARGCVYNPFDTLKLRLNSPESTGCQGGDMHTLRVWKSCRSAVFEKHHNYQAYPYNQK